MISKGYRELYLRRDLHITEDIVRAWSDYEEIDLCLNGNKLIVDKGISFLTMSNNIKVVITDCKGTGHFELDGALDAGDKNPINVENSTLILNHIFFNDVSRTLVEGKNNSNIIINYSTISNVKASTSIININGANTKLNIYDTVIATNYNLTPIIKLTDVDRATFSNLEVFNNQAKSSALVKVEKVNSLLVDGGEYYDNTSVNSNSTYANEGTILNIDNTNANVTITNGTKIYRNKSAYGEAGAIYVNSGTLNVENVVFDENIANKGASIYGKEDSILDVKLATFSYSKAEEYEGAAIYSSGKLTLDKVGFEKFNKKGSIVHVTSAATEFSASDLVFTGNNHEAVTGIQNEANIEVNLSTVSFINNDKMGLAMNFLNANSAKTVFDNLILDNNTFNNDAINVQDYKEIEIKSLTFTGNKMVNGSGIRLATDSKLTMVGTVSMTSNESMTGLIYVSKNAEFITKKTFIAEKNIKYVTNPNSNYAGTVLTMVDELSTVTFTGKTSRKRSVISWRFYQHREQ